MLYEIYFVKSSPKVSFVDILQMFSLAEKRALLLFYIQRVKSRKSILCWNITAGLPDGLFLNQNPNLGKLWKA
jgi:hypothetical protein